MKARTPLLCLSLLLSALLLLGSCAVRAPRHRMTPPPTHHRHEMPHKKKAPKPRKDRRLRHRRDVPPPPPERSHYWLAPGKFAPQPSEFLPEPPDEEIPSHLEK